MLTIPKWFIPTFHGDIKLEATSERSCIVIAEKVTDLEKAALDKLLVKATKKNWLSMVPQSLYSANKLKTAMDAPIEKVAKEIAKALKPGRRIVSAVRFVDGKMEETSDEVTDASKLPRAQAVAAASVAAPVLGCPPPDFERAEIKARDVLLSFIDDEQAEDFKRYNRFISTGAVTGHRYMITSRQARDQLSRYHRSLYDLDTEQPLCVHDWTIPAAEEMLSLHVLLQLPGWEHYLRQTEDVLDPYDLPRA